MDKMLRSSQTGYQKYRNELVEYLRVELSLSKRSLEHVSSTWYEDLDVTMGALGLQKLISMPLYIRLVQQSLMLGVFGYPISDAGAERVKKEMKQLENERSSAAGKRLVI